MALPGFNISLIRQATAAARNQPVLISGKVSFFGFGAPAFVRLSLTGPAASPQVRTFDTLASPITGDYSANVFSETEGTFSLKAEALPLVAPVGPQIGPELAESIEPPLVIGDVIGDQVFFELPDGGRGSTPLPPPTPIELRPEINITPIFSFPGFGGGDGGGTPPAQPAPGTETDAPAESGVAAPGQSTGRIVSLEVT